MKKEASIIVIIIIAAIAIAACSKPVQTLSVSELLDLGEKYLLETDYEQALVQFLKVIEVEPKNSRGYTGAAEAYIGLGQADKADEILRQGLKLLPDETSIMKMLDELSEATVQSGNSSPDAPLWDSFTDEQRAMLERLDYAAEAFDYEAVYDIMTSTGFLELYSPLEIDIRSRSSYNNLKKDENWHWYLTYWDADGENDDEKDYWWRKTNKNKMKVECQLWLQTSVSPSIAIRHMSLTDGIENGDFEIIHYVPKQEYGGEQLTHYEGTASNRLHSGTETVTDMITGERFVFEYDENGMCTNYLTDEHGNAYVQSADGEGRRHVMIDHAPYASTIH